MGMGDSYFARQAETVEAYGFEICSVAHGIDVDTLVRIVYSYRHSEGLMLERLRLRQEAFEKKQQDVYVIPIIQTIHRQLENEVEQASRETTIQKIRSLKVNPSAMKLQALMLLVDKCGIERCAFACHVEELKILEIVSRYRSAMGSRLERLKKMQEALLEERECKQEFDFKQTQQEWDQIYALLNEILETPAKHNGS